MSSVNQPTVVEAERSNQVRSEMSQILDVIQRQRVKIKRLKTQLKIYKQLDDEAEFEPFPADHPYGYVVAVCVFLVQFIVLGSINSYSVFTTSMTQDGAWDHPSYASVAFVNSLANFIGTIVGVYAGHASDVYGPRPLYIAASALIFMGQYFGSRSQSYYEFAVVYGLMVGTAGGFIISPGLGCVGGWFETRRALGLGIAYAGSGAGSATIPVAVSAIFSHYGEDWRPTMRWMAILAVPCLLASYAIHNREKAKRFDTARRSVKELVRSRPFAVLWVVGAFFGYGFFTAIYNFVPYAVAHGKGAYSEHATISMSQATSLMTMFGVMQCIGSVLVGIAADRYGNKLLFTVAHVVSGMLLAIFPFLHSYGSMMVLAGCFGFFAAGCITCYPAVASEFYRGPQLSSALALMYTGFGVGSLVGPPMTEVLINMRNERFDVGLVVAGGFFVLAAAVGAVLMPDPERFRTLMGAGEDLASSSSASSDGDDIVVPSSTGGGTSTLLAASFDDDVVASALRRHNNKRQSSQSTDQQQHNANVNSRE